ncbi:MAG TPA: YbhB/YbcL family Raf kinase inhibitor-like protein [Phototrophicaceae bacterium]|nr:YbhB/YbcL family Raf kinase inhibitor-like protein [Phototrophicaceae bacterium]
MMTLTSTAFKEGQPLPPEYTCSGKDQSPPLAWTGLPTNTICLALLMDDPDAPVGDWVHWIIYNIPPEEKGLAAGVPAIEKLSDGACQGINDFHRIGYGGPCPPKGKPHRYFFKLYALDTELHFAAGATKQTLLQAMQGHIVAETHLMGTYQRI